MNYKLKPDIIKLWDQANTQKPGSSGWNAIMNEIDYKLKKLTKMEGIFKVNEFLQYEVYQLKNESGLTE